MDLDTAPDHLIREHGLSFHLLYEGHSVLLDAGATGRFVENAARLGVDLTKVECAALSHGHDDHADGFAAFFSQNTVAKVYARPAIVEPHWLGETFIGVSPALLDTFGDRFDLADGPRDLLPGLHLIPDGVIHEQSLVAETPTGLVVLNSCCHAGVVAILRDIKARFPGQPIRAVLGGFHLMGDAGVRSLGQSPQAIHALGRALVEELEVGAIYTGHCTGIPGYEHLAQAVGARLHHLTTGLTLSYP